MNSQLVPYKSKQVKRDVEYTFFLENVKNVVFEVTKYNWDKIETDDPDDDDILKNMVKKFHCKVITPIEYKGQVYIHRFYMNNDHAEFWLEKFHLTLGTILQTESGLMAPNGFKDSMAIGKQFIGNTEVAISKKSGRKYLQVTDIRPITTADVPSYSPAVEVKPNIENKKEDCPF